MNYLIQFLGVLIGGMSLWGIFAPETLMRLVESTWRRPWGMAFAVAIRLVMGIVFILAAESTRYPLFFEVFGYLALVAALGIVLMGRKRVDRVIDYFRDKPPSLLRGWLLMGLALGLFFIYGAR